MGKVSWFVGATRKKAEAPKHHSTGTPFGSPHERTEPADAAFLTGAGLNTTNPDEERDPPPQPTPVTFPSCRIRDGVDWTDSSSPPPGLQLLFSKILKPSDVTDQHLEVLNFDVLPACPVNKLLPSASDGASYLNSLEPEPMVNTASYADAARTDPTILGKRKDFDERLKELQVDNDTAFRALTRTTRNGIKPPRLAYMRKFWEGLETMSQYWDCSLDQYYEASEAVGEARKSPKRQRLDSGAPAASTIVEPTASQINDDLKEFQSAIELKSTGQGPDSALGQQIFGQDRAASSPNSDKVSPVPNRTTRSPSASPEPRPRMQYKGRRTSTGRAMPDQFRSETVRAFIEGTVWPFQSSVSAPRQMPIVQFGKLNLPVRQTAAVYRLPRDRIRARQGA